MKVITLQILKSGCVYCDAMGFELVNSREVVNQVDLKTSASSVASVIKQQHLSSN